MEKADADVPDTFPVAVALDSTRGLDSTSDALKSQSGGKWSNPNELSSPLTRGSSSWVPPRGAFNEPDLPTFPAPGPGQYSPTVSLTKPRSMTAPFGMEDRWKHLGRQRDSTCTQPGSNSRPQDGLSPGPVYKPAYDAIEVSRSASFPTASRSKASGVPSGLGSKRPGPGTYSPYEQHAVLSTKPRAVRMASFPKDARLKYLGEQLEGGTVVHVASPGPAYALKLDLVRPYPGGVAFGQPQSKEQRAMRITERWPSPASYSPLPDSAVLSTKRNHSPVSFGREKRFSPSSDKADALQPRRPLIPGPKYLPMYDGVRPQTRSATIGTAKRFSYR